ncbi:MAG: hypothetical protein KAX78_01875, partial [Phycisphaerae bacterium]|nr:hypothetical protein [Phycisphaerae bacterium]
MRTTGWTILAAWMLFAAGYCCLADDTQAGPDADFALVNLDFETDGDGDGWPDGWTDESEGRASCIEIVNGDHVIRIEGDGEFRKVWQQCPLPKGTSEIYVSAMAKLD